MLENVEIWDESLQKELPKALVLTVECLLNQVDNNSIDDFYNDIIFHFIKTIASEHKELCSEYVKHFSSLINLFCEKKLAISDKAIEYSTLLGSFGKNIASRRYSVYICVCLMRVFWTNKS